MQKVRITERGWAGHFIGSDSCRFRRNTLVEYKDRRVVVSTVGNYSPFFGVTDLSIGCWYETKAFIAEVYQGIYLDADVTKEIPLSCKCGLFADDWEELLESCPSGVDNVANDMHERAVHEIYEKIRNDGFWDAVEASEKRSS